jgi:hypothetical protein
MNFKVLCKATHAICLLIYISLEDSQWRHLSLIITLASFQNSLTNQNLFSAFYFVSFSWNFFLIPVSYGSRCSCRCNRKMASSHLQYSKGHKRHLPMFVWWNNCTARVLFTSRATSASFGDQQVEIISGVVLTSVDFQRKFELVAVLLHT